MTVDPFARHAIPYQAAADAVMVLHFAVVLFVTLGLPAILVGNALGWHWVNTRGWRIAHVVAIGVVVAQAWLGRYCGLTELESWLRVHAGQEGYRASFVQHWVQRVMYYEAPLWVFAAVYTAYGALVAWAWWRFPPLPGDRRLRGTPPGVEA